MPNCARKLQPQQSGSLIFRLLLIYTLLDALDGFGKFAHLTMRSHVVLRMLHVLISLLVYDDGLAERHWVPIE